MPPARGNENHAAFRAMTVLRLGPGFGNRVVWGRGQLPTVTNWGLMERSRAFDDFDRQAVLLDISEQTALERADGNWEAVLPTIASGPGRSIDERAADFDRHILRHWPLRSYNQQSAKEGTWFGWRDSDRSCSLLYLGQPTVTRMA